jgi:hypothetical protein
MSQWMRTTYSKFGVDSTMAATSKSGEIGSKAAQGRVDGMVREHRERTVKEGVGAHATSCGTVCGSGALLRSLVEGHHGGGGKKKDAEESQLLSRRLEGRLGNVFDALNTDTLGSSASAVEHGGGPQSAWFVEMACRTRDYATRSPCTSTRSGRGQCPPQTQ